MTLWMALSAGLTGCANIPTPAQRLAHADQLASAQGWQGLTLTAPVPSRSPGQEAFSFKAYAPAVPAHVDTLSIYIEGDGLAWLTPDQPSDDPSPVDPLALRLALAQPHGTAAYLARPGQFNAPAPSTVCPPDYWTDRRFAPEVIDATNAAIDQLKARFAARHLVLVGYSGGGAVAALAAARRSDVARLITVAGNLDHRNWTTLHRLRPLSGSLNPADEIGALQQIPQWHLVGALDENVTPDLVRGFAALFPADRRPQVSVIDGFDHRCCWVQRWATWMP